jgi:hypothetical protein
MLKGQSSSSKPFVYVSTGNKKGWKPILGGKYYYGIGNNGALIVAVGSNKNADSLLYSLNYGSTWHKFELNNKVNVDYLFVKDNSEHPCVFIFGTNEQSSRTILLRISFSPKHNDKDEVALNEVQNDYDDEEKFNSSKHIPNSPVHTSSTAKIEVVVTEIIKKQPQAADELPIKPEASKAGWLVDCEIRCMGVDLNPNFICITEQNKCDGKFDCLNQIDELDCKLNFEAIKKYVEEKRVYIIIYVILGAILITSIVFTVLLVKMKFRISKKGIYTSLNSKRLKKNSQIFVSSVIGKVDMKRGAFLSDDKDFLFKKDSEQF